MKNLRKQIKLFTASLLLGVGLTYAFTLPASVSAQTQPAKTAVCEGVNQTGGSCNNNGADLGKVIKIVVNILSTIAAVAGVIMLIVGGIKYVTSGGDSSKVSSAKSTIIYAIVGLVVVAMAQFVVRFVLFRATQP